MPVRITLLFLISVLLAGCGRPVPPATGPYEVHFSRKHDIPGRLISLIDASRQEILIASYEANLPSVLDALRAAEKRGVRVSLLVDDLTLADTIGMPAHTYTDHDPGSLMHAKFGVFDREICWLGSFNLTYGSAYESDNDLLLIRSPETAARMRTAFQCLINGLAPPSSLSNAGRAAALYFTPRCRSALLRELKRADREILFSLYVLTDPEIIKLLQEKAASGVRVRGVLERSWPGNQPAFAALRSAGVAVKWDRNYNLNHYKTFVFDGQRIITGSYNPSRSAERNQEILAVIDSPKLAEIYRKQLIGTWFL